MPPAAQSPLARYPMLRIAVPWMAGIIVAWHWPSITVAALLGGAAVAALLALTVASRSPQRRLTVRHLWLPAIAVLLTAMSMANTLLRQPPRLPLDHLNGHTVAGRIDDLWATDFGMQLDVTLNVPDSLSADGPHRSATVRLNTDGCDYALQPGDVVAFPCLLSPIANAGNPEEFDYATHLLDKGIRYAATGVPIERVGVVGHNATLLTRLRVLRSRLEQRVFRSGLRSSTAQTVVALSLGDTRPLTPEARQRLSQAGVAHLLALSGLHVGIAASLVWLLLFPLAYSQRMRWLRPVLMMLTMAAYAALSGLSASVCRAAIMLGVTLLASILHRKTTPFNSLLLAALIILVADPPALRSVSFQFSFLTVAAIVLLAPGITHRQHGWRAILRAAMLLAATTLIATLATAALSAHYFHQFSLAGLVANMVAIPLFPVLMGLCVVFVPAAAAGMSLPWLNSAIEHGIDSLNALADTVAQWPLAHFSNIYADDLEVTLYYLAAISLSVWLLRRGRTWLIVGAVLIATQICLTQWRQWTTPTAGLVVFNESHATPVLLFDSGHGLFHVADNDLADLTTLRRRYSGVLARYGIDSVALVPPQQRAEAGRLFIIGNRGYVAGTRIAWFPTAVPDSTWQPDVAILTRPWRGDTLPPPAARARAVVVSGATDSDGPQGITHRLAIDGAYLLTTP